MVYDLIPCIERDRGRIVHRLSESLSQVPDIPEMTRISTKIPLGEDEKKIAAGAKLFRDESFIIVSDRQV